MTTKERAIAYGIIQLADEGMFMNGNGIIQEGQLIAIMSDPRNRRRMTIREAWSILLPHLDANDIAKAIYG